MHSSRPASRREHSGPSCGKEGKCICSCHNPVAIAIILAQMRLLHNIPTIEALVCGTDSYNFSIIPLQPQVHVGTKLEFSVGTLMYIHEVSAETTPKEYAITGATASIVVILLIIIAMMIALLCWHRRAKRKRRQVCCMKGDLSGKICSLSVCRAKAESILLSNLSSPGSSLYMRDGKEPPCKRLMACNLSEEEQAFHSWITRNLSVLSSESSLLSLPSLEAGVCSMHITVSWQSVWS